MGFKKDSFAKVWSVEGVSDTNTKLRISISRKNRQTGEYEEDFAGFVSCIGSMAAKKALALKEGDRIRLGDTDVTTWYNKEKKVTYTTYKIFDFEVPDSNKPDNNSSTDISEPQPEVDSGEADNRLPF